MVNLLNNRYKLEKILGQGGMGRVYLAQDNRNKEKVAIKQVIIPISAVNKNKFIERFTREYLFLSSINHPNVIKALDFFEENKSLFFVMEFIYGLSLNNFICKKLANLSLLERLAVAIQIARSVEVVNTLGIIHRDIKPANMIVDEKHNLIKLLDFGIAKSTDTSMASLTKTGAQIGTPAYMSPEQVNGNVSQCCLSS